MIRGVGIDVVEVSRFEDRPEAFLAKLFTPEELEIWHKRGNVTEYLASRFAAKEAVFKAISRKLNNKYDIGWKNIEVVNDENGRPHAGLLDIEIQEIEEMDVSISHCKEYAVANVVVVWK